MARSRRTRPRGPGPQRVTAGQGNKHKHRRPRRAARPTDTHPRRLAGASPDLPDAPASDGAPEALAMHSRDPSITALPSRRYRDDEARRGRPVDPAEQTILAAAEESPGWAAFAGDWQQYERQLIMAEADECAGLARRAGQTNVHPVTLDQVDHDVHRVARAFVTEPLVYVLYSGRQGRDV